MTPLAECRAAALDAVALNQQQARRIFDPSPEVDSLAERIVSLRRCGVPEALVCDLLADARALWQDNGVEGARQRDVIGCLEATTALPPRFVGGARSVKALAAELRPLLRDPDRLEDLRAVLVREPYDRLTSRGLRGELGEGRYALLLAHLDARPSEVAA